MYLYRAGADTLIPTEVVLRGEPWKDVTKEVEVNDIALEIVLESARDILECLEKY